MKWNLVLVSIILGLFSVSNADDWLTEEILDHSGIGSDCDLAIDETGGLHICFQYKHNVLPGSNLYYAFKAGSDDWEIIPVDVEDYDFLGDDCEIDLDSDENPHISYLYELDWEYIPYIKYAAFDGTSWQTEQLTFYPESAESGTSVFMDGDDNPHLFYSLYSTGLVHQWIDATDTWVSESLESGYMIRYPHAAGDLSGNISVAYFYLFAQWADWELHFANYNGTSWDIETAFDANPCWSTWQLDMVYDLQGHPHIVYVASEETDDLSMLLHTWHDGSVWSTDNLGATSNGVYTFPAIAVDDSNSVHISYSLRPTGSGDGVLHHISDESDTWIDVIVKDGINSWNTAIDIAPDNQPHIIYYNYSGGITSHAWRSDGTGIEVTPFTPAVDLLGSPYPNPCSGFSSIGYTMTENGAVRLELYDMSGRIVAVLADGSRQAGDYLSEVADLSPGVYIFRLSAGDIIETRKLVVF